MNNLILERFATNFLQILKRFKETNKRLLIGRNFSVDQLKNKIWQLSEKCKDMAT